MIAGRNGHPGAFRKNDWNDSVRELDSRLDVFGISRSVLRGGYGVYYPSQMWRENYGNPAGFAQTSTTYNSSDANRQHFCYETDFPPCNAAARRGA